MPKYCLLLHETYGMFSLLSILVLGLGLPQVKLEGQKTMQTLEMNYDFMDYLVPVCPPNETTANESNKSENKTYGMEETMKIAKE